MECFLWMVSLWVDGAGLGQAPPILLGPRQLQKVNEGIKGRIVSFTRHHGCDHRIWSPALNERRDLLVYLPPGYDPSRKYPLALFLHGAAQDEQIFLQALVQPFDQAIARGEMPPVIVAAPDGSIGGRVNLWRPASFWCDSRAGRFETYLMVDVWNFLMRQFSIRPERESHAILGVSMGGSAAVALGIKHRDRFKMAVGVMPLVDLRYVDCKGRYRTPFDPCCVGQRERARGFERLGCRKLFCLRFNDLFAPLFGRGAEMVAGMSRINPAELMERENLRPGEMDLYIAYGAKDEFNVAAQVDSFLHRARPRGIEVTVDRDPEGRHNLSTGLRLMPGVLRWAAQHVPRD